MRSTHIFFFFGCNGIVEVALNNWWSSGSTLSVSIPLTHGSESVGAPSSRASYIIYYCNRRVCHTIGNSFRSYYNKIKKINICFLYVILFFRCEAKKKKKKKDLVNLELTFFAWLLFAFAAGAEVKFFFFFLFHWIGNEISVYYTPSVGANLIHSLSQLEKTLCGTDDEIYKLFFTTSRARCRCSALAESQVNKDAERCSLLWVPSCKLRLLLCYSLTATRNCIFTWAQKMKYRIRLATYCIIITVLLDWIIELCKM